MGYCTHLPSHQTAYWHTFAVLCCYQWPMKRKEIRSLLYTQSSFALLIFRLLHCDTETVVPSPVLMLGDNIRHPRHIHTLQEAACSFLLKETCPSSSASRTHIVFTTLYLKNLGCRTAWLLFYLSIYPTCLVYLRYIL